MDIKKEKILITCALPYVNNVPHIGNIAGSHLPSDIFARFCRIAGHETVFIGGSDEHGTPIEVSANKLGVEPQELTDKYYQVHKEIYGWLDISYDNFSRTSLKLHHDTTKEFFKKVNDNGYISKDTLNLPRCEKDDRFLPDRYVEGTCPKCGYENARGDQCDNCSALLNPDELKDPKCTICGSSPEFVKTEHLFLNLDKIALKLEEWIQSNKEIWSSQVVKLAMGWIREGLRPRCITRDIKWGVKVPMEGYEDKVFYVWFDAPIGYVSSTKEWAQKIGQPEKWKEFWQSDQAKIFHFIGKDNIPFHTIFWPGMLMANGDYALPYRVAGLQYLNFEGSKISKSRGFGIFCENLAKTGVSSDIWRYYLTHLIPETDDSEWKWSQFKERINNELVANLGNFLYRTLSFLEKNFDGEIPKPSLTQEDKKILALGEKFKREYYDLHWDIRQRDALKKVLQYSDEGNKYFQKNEPWKVIKEDRERAGTVLYICANMAYDLAILMSPFLPKSAIMVSEQLGIPLGKLDDVGKEKLKHGTKLGITKPIFPKFDDPTIEKLKKITSKVTKYEDMFRKEKLVSFDFFKKFDLRTAKVLSAERVKGTDKLLKLQVKVGEKEKQIIAGIAEIYPPEELIGKSIVIINNLEPAVIRGEKSQGMLLTAKSGKNFTLIMPDKEIGSGSKIH